MDPRQPFVRYTERLGRLGRLPPEACDALRRLNLRVVGVKEGVDLVREGDRPSESFVLIDGFACRYKMVAGGHRQILSMHLPGEAPDLQSLHLDRLDHSIAAMAPCRVAYFSHAELAALCRRYPDIGDALWKASCIDASILRESIANIGRRSALQRMAHMFCELHVRMREGGQADLRGFELPLSQASLADALGMSAVHVNRTLQQLRRCGVIESRGRFHLIRDWDRLRRIGDFDPAYLHLSEAVLNAL